MPYRFALVRCVLIGGLITVAVEWWQSRLKQRVARRAATRLVHRELTEALACVQAALEGYDPEAEPSDEKQATRDAAHRWLKHMLERGRISDTAFTAMAPILAEHLSDGDWVRVCTAYFTLTILVTTPTDSKPYLIGTAMAFNDDEDVPRAIALLAPGEPGIAFSRLGEIRPA